MSTIVDTYPQILPALMKHYKKTHLTKSTSPIKLHIWNSPNFEQGQALVLEKGLKCI